MRNLSFKTWLLALPLTAMGLSGCTRDYKFQPVDMWNGARLKPYEQVNFFNNRSVSQQAPANTVARSQDRLNEALYYGTTNGVPVKANPLFAAAATPKAKLEILQRGQERYQIYCQPCHGNAGIGDGMIVTRGFAKPPSYHIPRLRNVPDGYLYDVITNGYGSMYSYSNRITPRDRWAIVAYIRTLQRSQNASAEDVASANAKAANQPASGGHGGGHASGDKAIEGASAGGEAHGSHPGGAGEPSGNATQEHGGTH